MFNRKTVFVVGAGASADAGLPVGSQLCARLASMLDFKFERMSSKLLQGDQVVLDAIRRYILRPEIPNRDIGPFINAGREIADAMRATTAPSIDSYLNNHSDDPNLLAVGKMGIVAAILAAERQSKLFHDIRSDTSRPAAAVVNCWYPKFLQLLTEEVRAADLPRLFDNVSIICFNYDRCIEQYLTHGLAAHLRITLEKAATLASKLSIIHPYGSVGSLAGFNALSGPVIPFGGGLDEPQSIVAASETIRTYTEQVHDENSMWAMHEAIENADAICFLGFGFHRPNMRLLRSRGVAVASRLYATTHGISTNDWTNVVELISLALGKAPVSMPTIVQADTCNNLFDQNRLSLRPE